MVQKASDIAHGYNDILYYHTLSGIVDLCEGHRVTALEHFSLIENSSLEQQIIKAALTFLRSELLEEERWFNFIGDLQPLTYLDGD